MSDYGEAEKAPWEADMIKFVRPDYPSEYRERHIEGTGLFQITLDVNTGSVANVTVLRSTGSSGLDSSAIRAIRSWRWRPRTWKEVDMPVTFTMRRREPSYRSARELAIRGVAHYRKGDNDNAIKALDEAIRLQPTLPILYIDRGAAYQSKGERHKALADFNRAIQLDPKSARAYCDRAILEDDLFRQPDKALADYNQAIRLAPDFQRASFNRGEHFLGQHNYERAIADYTRAIQLMPNELSTYAARAYAYARQGDRARAVSDATMAIRRKPREDFYDWRATDFQLRANAYRILGRTELALRDLREAVRVAPKDPTANASLAWFLATCPEDRFRNGTEAVSVGRKACEISHWERSDCIDTLAAAYAEVGDFEEAAKYEKQSLNDSSIAPKEREEREKRLTLFQQRKPFRDELFGHH
jgi:TonB family protein